MNSPGETQPSVALRHRPAALARAEVDPGLIGEGEFVRMVQRVVEGGQDREAAPMNGVMRRRVDRNPAIGEPRILSRVMGHAQHIQRLVLAKHEGCDAERGRGDEAGLCRRPRLLKLERDQIAIVVLAHPGRRQAGELGAGDVIGRLARTDHAAEPPRRIQHERIEIAAAHHPHRADELLGAREIDHRRQPPLVRRLPRQSLQIGDELRPVGQAAAGVDAPQPLMERDLADQQCGQIGEALGLRHGEDARRAAEYAERAEPAAVAGRQWRCREEAQAGALQLPAHIVAIL
jgi:hypothetical protein